nr:MAG TPA: outer membrane protein assembly factor [Caudoviricetes sp.]
MKIKSIILSFVLATTMTGCAVMNQIGEHLEEMGRQARVREELHYPTSLDSEEKRMKWFNDIKYKNNPNFCYYHDDCVKKGFGFDRYIYIVGQWNGYSRGYYGFRNNKIAEVGYELSKCYQSKRPKNLKNDQKYNDYCVKLMNKIDDMEGEYSRRNYGSGDDMWTIIETELFK